MSNGLYYRHKALLLCPFCGSKAYLCEGGNSTIKGKHKVSCEKDCVTIPPDGRWFTSQEQAIKAWNTRA